MRNLQTSTGAVLVLVALAIFESGQSPAQSDTHPPDQEAMPIRIVVLGDSITKGVRTGVSAEETFAACIQSDLTSAGLKVDVVNLGIGGERTDQALKRLTRDVLNLKPQIVTIMYGTNDSYVDQGASASRLSPEQYGQNLRSLVTELKTAGVRPVLMTEPCHGTNAPMNGLGEHPNLRLQVFMDVCRDVAQETDTPLVDHYAHWRTRNEFGTDVGTWTTDQCHPNPAGHRILADTMLPVLKKLLPPASTR